VNIDTALWMAGISAEAVVIGVLFYRRIWRGFHFFLAYSVWTLVGNAGLYTLRGSASYQSAYMVLTLVDSTLLFCVLTELGLSILRPIRTSLPRFLPLIVGCFIIALGAAIWPFVAFPGAASLAPFTAVVLRLEQDVSVLRVLVFLLLAASSRFLSLGFRDRELQIVTGLGFYSLVSVAVAMLHTHQATLDQYVDWNRIVVASYVCSTFYWIFSFNQKEAERREMSPQVQNLLLTLAGSAHSTRAAMASSSPRPRNKQELP
jgi:hypothetical protein